MIVHYKRTKNTWETPLVLFNKLNKEFNFTLDPCASVDNYKVKKYYTKSDNGLEKSWRNERVFMNPPYGNEINKWIRKAYFESTTGALVVCLIPSRTDTNWWHNYVMRSTEIRFIRGRLIFEEAESSAPFPSAIIVYKEEVRIPLITSYYI